MSDIVVKTIYFISSALLYPTMILLIAGFVASILLTGGFVAEVRRRRRVTGAFRRLMGDAVRLSPAEITRRVTDGAPALPLLALAARDEDPDRERILADLELVARRQLALLSLGIRVAPILGLAGTLIPLGPAMIALSAGDTQTLSSRLVVAFSTSVIGLFISGVCYVMHSFRKNWYARDILDAERLLDVLERAAAREEDRSS